MLEVVQRVQRDTESFVAAVAIWKPEATAHDAEQSWKSGLFTDTGALTMCRWQGSTIETEA